LDWLEIVGQLADSG